jgi:hypothetical protein
VGGQGQGLHHRHRHRGGRECRRRGASRVRQGDDGRADRGAPEADLHLRHHLRAARRDAPRTRRAPGLHFRSVQSIPLHTSKSAIASSLYSSGCLFVEQFGIWTRKCGRPMLGSVLVVLRTCIFACRRNPFTLCMKKEILLALCCERSYALV